MEWERGASSPSLSKSSVERHSSSFSTDHATKKRVKIHKDIVKYCHRRAVEYELGFSPSFIRTEKSPARKESIRCFFVERRYRSTRSYYLILSTSTAAASSVRAQGNYVASSVRVRGRYVASSKRIPEMCSLSARKQRKRNGKETKPIFVLRKICTGVINFKFGAESGGFGII